MDMANDEQQQLAKKIREIVCNTRPRVFKESVQNSALALLKGGEWSLMLLKMEYFQCLRKKSEEESDNLFPPEFHERTLGSESST